MTTHTDTPIYDQAFDAALSKAVDIDDMEQLTILENMNVETSPVNLNYYTPDPIPF